ncbi:uncharacterized protein TRAVEDRAFT_67418 [Trametes versicolor FP-101664 SS1]|uniref:uncharacterized protein n=1 Tax=Trametes versicolor (strain FP-101664) TaxID=717944 RepID=UPI000462363B|nr:uncharacterized protein TRAVEDRAFT_67418 [Trametes versicolor FP-101664 SS1]EIW52328.1 hypothetical protein TRAVEDRAFT_67418 [Trametes versicolor FP-101664 SS1]
MPRRCRNGAPAPYLRTSTRARSLDKPNPPHSAFGTGIIVYVARAPLVRSVKGSRSRGKPPRFMALPPDACSLIVKYVADSRPTLVSLCTVSKQFQVAAERALYNTLHLTTYDLTISVCRLLACTPRVAGLVVALSVFNQGEESGDESGSEDDDAQLPDADADTDAYWSGLAGALRNTSRLRFLSFYFSDGGQTEKAWILDGCTFQLRTFHCDLAWDTHLQNFLATQIRLSDLYLADFQSLAIAPPISTSSFLPKLTVLECTFSEAAAALVPDRPVCRVKTCFTHSRLEEKRTELQIIAASLRQSKKRLRALDIADSSYTPEFSLELLSHITHEPALCAELRYIGTLVLPVGGQQRLEFYGFLMRLPQLRCIEVDVSDWDPPPTHAAALRALTHELRLYCPTVTSVIFVFDFERHYVRMEGHLAVYDEDALTDGLWREL